MDQVNMIVPGCVARTVLGRPGTNAGVHVVVALSPLQHPET
jgi:hypothetical protein